MYAQGRDAIVARLNSVANVGIVNDYRRHVTTYALMKSLYTTTIGGVEQIRAWDVAWESAPLSRDAWQADGKVRMAGDHTFVVRGYMGANDGDATDKTFSALVEQVLIALVTCAANLAPKQSHVNVILRSNDYLMFEVPNVGRAMVQHCEIAVIIRLEVVI